MDLQRFCTTLLLPLLLLTAAPAHDDSWSVLVPAEVRAVEGYPVVLPCSFARPYHAPHPSLSVVWRLGHGHAGTVLFRCSSLNGSQQCQAAPEQDRRYRLEGNPREHDLSLRIASAGLHDSGRYYCRVELHGHGHAHYESLMGTHLRVEAPPRILSLTVGAAVGGGALEALCRARGSPPPDVLWTDPDEAPLGDAGSPLSHPPPPPPRVDQDRHGTAARLPDVRPGHQYTCAASNPLGGDRATLYVALPQTPATQDGRPSVPLVLGLALAAKATAFLALGAWMIKRSLESPN